MNFKAKMFSAQSVQKNAQMNTLMHTSGPRFQTTSHEHYTGVGKTKEERELDQKHRIHMDKDSFSRYQQEALLKNVNLKANSHDATLCVFADT